MIQRNQLSKDTHDLSPQFTTDDLIVVFADDEAHPNRLLPVLRQLGLQVVILSHQSKAKLLELAEPDGHVEGSQLLAEEDAGQLRTENEAQDILDACYENYWTL